MNSAIRKESSFLLFYALKYHLQVRDSTKRLQRLNKKNAKDLFLNLRMNWYHGVENSKV